MFSQNTIENLPIRMLFVGLIIGSVTGAIMAALASGNKFTS